MDADAIALLRAQARQTSGDWIGLQEPGDWFAGTVGDPAHQTVETPFGESEELLVVNPTINGNENEGTMTFRLSRSVLQRELGTGAEKDVPEPGWSVFVSYKGTRTSKAGREFHAYEVAKSAPSLESAQTVAKAKAPKKKADGDEDIPF
jgi:hypothetical protein